jgi:hypothetical protein
MTIVSGAFENIEHKALQMLQLLSYHWSYFAIHLTINSLSMLCECRTEPETPRNSLQSFTKNSSSLNLESFASIFKSRIKKIWKFIAAANNRGIKMSNLLVFLSLARDFHIFIRIISDELFIARSLSVSPLRVSRFSKGLTAKQWQ